MYLLKTYMKIHLTLQVYSMLGWQHPLNNHTFK